jgi:retron-type reverse transcriptase
MLRAKNLFNQMYMYHNLYTAFYKAAKGKRKKSDVIDYKKDLDNNLNHLQNQIIELNPDVGHYRFFVIRDPKVRQICAASFPERVLHHAIMNICEPVLDNYAIHDSYACRKDKGTIKAIERCQAFVRQSEWFLKLDIKKYFDSIDHEIAIHLLSKKFKESAIITMFQKIFDTYHTTPYKGLPIGNLVSQHVANFYLGPMDHWLYQHQKVKKYIRYMDDFIIFSNNKRFLKELLENINCFLNEQLALILKHTIQLNRTRLGVPFLGFRIFPDRIQLLQGSKKRFKQKFQKYEHMYQTDQWSEQELARHMEPLFAFIKTGQTLAFRKNVIQRFGVSS